jgi:Family of unknown function (DUF6502)
MGAFRQVVDSLLELTFDAGITVQQLNYLIRERAVHTASNRVVRDNGRLSKSRVAIITGLPRSEVARIHKAKDKYVKSKVDQHPARRVLAAWFDDPRFLGPSGDPAILPIFGKRRTFEHLVAEHGSGIPVRAMLDELLQIEAVETVVGQRLRAKGRLPISVGQSRTAIGAVGQRCSDLLQTLNKNMRRASPPLFEATALVLDADPSRIPLIRREIAKQGTSFIGGASSLLARARHDARTERGKTAGCRLGLTVYYFEDIPEGTVGEVGLANTTRRTNFRRRS